MTNSNEEHLKGSLLGDVPLEFLCPISKEIMFNPVQSFYGHNYDKSCLMEYINIYNACPITNKPLFPHLISHNSQLKKSIEDWLSAKETAENKKSRKKSLNLPSSISMSSISVFQSSKEPEGKRRHKKIFGVSVSQNSYEMPEQRIKSMTPPMDIKKAHNNYSPSHFSNSLPDTSNDHLTKRSFSTPDSLLESLTIEETKPNSNLHKRNSTPIKEKIEQNISSPGGGQMYTSSYGRNILSRGQNRPLSLSNPKNSNIFAPPEARWFRRGRSKWNSFNSLNNKIIENAYRNPNLDQVFRLGNTGTVNIPERLFISDSGSDCRQILRATWFCVIENRLLPYPEILADKLEHCYQNSLFNLPIYTEDHLFEIQITSHTDIREYTVGGSKEEFRVVIRGYSKSFNV